MGSPAIFKGKLVKFLAKAGILVPSRGEVDRTTEPAAGETAFNTDSNSLEVYNGSSWGSVDAISSELKQDTADFTDSLVFGYEFGNSRNYSTYYRTLVVDNGASAFFYGEFQSYCKKSELKIWSAVEINASDAEISSYKLKLVDGTIQRSIIIGDYIFIQGNFKRYGDTQVNGFAKVSLNTGELDPAFDCGDGFSGTVNEFAVDSAGFLYAVGNFYSYKGEGVTYLCKIDPVTGDLILPFSSYLNTNAGSVVYSIAIDSSDNIFIGGIFTTYNSVSTNRIVKLNNTDGTRDPNFDMGTGFNSTVRTLALDDEGNLYCGGQFTSYNGTSLNRIAKLNAVTGALDTNFTIGSGFNNSVLDIIVTDNQRIFVAGDFTNYNGQSLSRIAKLNTNDATLDATFSTSLTIFGVVEGILPDGNDSIYLYGGFGYVNSVITNRMVKLNATTGAKDTVFDTSTGFSYTVSHASLYNDKIYAFGPFTNYKNVNPLVPANNCVKLRLPDLTPDLNFTSTTLFQSKVTRMISDGNNSVYACGNFFYYNDTYRPRLVKFNQNTGDVDTTFVPAEFNNPPEELHLHGADGLFCGGGFVTYDSQTANRIVKLSATTGARDSNFVSGSGFDGSVYAIISDSTDIYVGGYYSNYNGTPAKSIVKIDANTGAINTTFDSSTKGPSQYANVRGLLLDNNTGLYAYGYFNQYNGISCGGHFKVNRNTNDTDPTFVLNPFSLSGSYYMTIRSAVTDGTSVYVAGQFDKYGSTQRHGLVKFDFTTGTVDSTFDTTSGIAPLNTYVDNEQISLIPNSNLLLYSGDDSISYKGTYSTAIIDRTTANIASSVIPIESFEVSLVDHNRVYYINTIGNLTVSIPTNLPIGFRFRVAQLGSGTITVAGAAGVTINSPDGSLVTTGQYTSVDIVSYAANTYLVTARVQLDEGGEGGEGGEGVEVSGSDITGPIYSRASGEMTKIYGKTASDALAERAVSLWSTTTLWPTTINANSVCWSSELGIFVSVGSVGSGTRVATSYNGINWTPRSTPVDNTFRSVCWSPELGLFCAVCSGTYSVLISSDGIYWVQRLGPLNTTWESVCWSPELGMFVAAQTNGNPMYSIDGLNWNLGSGVSGGPYKSICWSPELGIFVIIGSGSVATSSDGITWTETPIGFGLVSAAGVCWSPDLGIFVAVTDSSGTFATSTDGTTWTVQTSPSATSQWVSVAWSPELGLFCASAITGTATRIATSPDGINWTLKTYYAENAWKSVCWSPELGIFCIVSSTNSINNGAIISKDVGLYRERKVVPKYFYRAAQSSEASKVLKTWTLRSSSVMNANLWSDICWSPELGIFVAVGDGSSGGTYIATSPNGIDWTARTPSIAASIISSVVWSPELKLFVAVAATTNVNAIMTSPDGITWTTRTQPSAISLYSVTWSPELSLFVAVGTNWIITSPDGTTWTSRTSPASRNWRSVTWSPELRLFCAVAPNAGFTSDIMISTNGTTWSTKTAPDSNGLKKVTWSSERGMFIASTNNTDFNHFAISYDGSFWSGISVLNFTGLGVDGNVVWCSELGLFVATSYGSTLTSTDGKNWSTQGNALGTGFSQNWSHKIWSPDLGIFVFLTDSGTVSTLLTSRKSNILSEILNLSNSRQY